MILHIQMDGKTRRVEMPWPLEGTAQCTVDGAPVAVDAQLLEPGVLSLVVEGRSYRCVLDIGTDERAVLMETRRFSYAQDDPRSLRSRRGGAADADGPRPIKAPMPGRVVRILAAIGDTVEAQQGVLVIEAMKMQNELKAPKAGVISRITVSVGDTVNAGAVLAMIE